jgi:hypothetical protein
MKRVTLVSIIVVVIAIVAWAARIVVYKGSAPGKVIALAERYDGWIDDNIPFTQIYVNKTMPPEDRKELLRMLPYLKGMKEIELEINSPDAKWLTNNLDLSAAECLSLSGVFQLSDIGDLIRHSPRLNRLIIYDANLPPADAEGLKRLCGVKRIEVLLRAKPMPAIPQ